MWYISTSHISGKYLLILQYDLIICISKVVTYDMNMEHFNIERNKNACTLLWTIAVSLKASFENMTIQKIYFETGQLKLDY